MSTTPWWKTAAVAPVIAGTFLALPTLITAFPPMSDLPLHVGVIGVLRHLGDPAYFPPDLYHLNLGHPNQLFHLVAWALSYLVGVDWAVKLVVAGAQVGILAGGGRLARHMGVSPWAALLLSPLALGWGYFWGLVANLVGLAVLFFALPGLDRAADRPSVRGILTSGGWMILLYLAHESVMVVAGSAVLVFTLGYPLRARETAMRLAPLAIAVAIFFLHLAVQTQLAGSAEAGGLAATEFHSPLTNLAEVPATLTGPLDLVSRTALFSLAMAGIALFAVERWRARETQGFRLHWPRPIAPFVHRFRYEIVAVLNGIAFFAAPFGVAGGTMFNHRFYHPAYALLALALAPQVTRRRVSLLTKVVAMTLPLGLLLVDWPQFEESGRSARELNKLIPEIAMSSAVAYVEADTDPGDRIFNTSTAACRLVPERGGRVLFSFTESLIAPARMETRFRWDEVRARVSVSSLDLSPPYDLHLFRYLLVHSRTPLLATVVAKALEPEAHVVDTSGEWTLLESNLELVPIDSPQPRPPDPLPPFLRLRAAQVLRKAQAEGIVPGALP
jgi:hypothetical protein